MTTTDEQLRQLLADVIAESEAQSGQRSPLRDQTLDLSKPSQGIDEPIPYGSGLADMTLPPHLTELPPVDVSSRVSQTDDALTRPVPEPAYTDDWIDRALDELRQSPTEIEAPKDPHQLGTNMAESIMLAPYVAKRALIDPMRQIASGVGKAIVTAPTTIGASLAAIPAYINRQLGDEGPAQSVDALNEQSAELGQRMTDAYGAPQTPVEDFSHSLGESLIPAGRYTIPLTIANQAIKSGVEWWNGPDPTTQPARIDTTSRPQAPGIFDFTSEANARAPRPKKPDLTLGEMMEKNSALTHVIDTVGGPAKVRDSELATLGGIAAVSLGMIFAPAIFRTFRFGTLPPLRSVRDAAPGTVAISTPGDFARSTGDDISVGATRIARRAGLHPAAVEELETTFRIQTRGAAQSLVDSAVTTGRMESPAFTFRTNVSMRDLSETDAPPVRQYLQLRQTFDDINEIDTAIQLGTRPPNLTGPTQVRGLTLQDVTQQMHALEQATPAVRQVSQAFNENITATRRFEATGEYATKSRRRFAELQAERPNTFSRTRDYDQPHDPDESPFLTQAERMRVDLRVRLENEARGKYIDAMRSMNPDYFVRISPREYNDNPSWQKNTTTIYRRGKKEYYTSDPFLKDVLEMDPYYINGGAANTFYMTKRLLEMGATGSLAPWFAPTSALRSWQISKLTAGAGTGFRSSTIVGSALAIPQQLVPQLARAISTSLERGSGQYLSTILGQGNVDALATRLAHAYDQSLYARLQDVGTTRANILNQQAQANNALANAIRTMQGPHRTFLEGYKALLESVHNAPAFNFARRNEGIVPLPRLAAEARHLTGDPRIGGQYYTASGSPIRFEGEGRLSQTGAALARGYGLAAETMRTSVPWFNYTVQGAKRIGEAYLQNPAMFVGKAWLYTAMPAAVGAFYARSLGQDPHGVDYMDYMMNRRSDYAKQMNWYIPLPGRPAEEGIELPRFHELAPLARMMEIAMDHAMRSSIFSEKENFMQAAHSFLQTAVYPPLPPIMNAAFATQGMVGPQGLFTGEAYKRRNDPFDQTGGMPTNLELFTRALGGGIADVVGSGYAAWSQTPKELGKVDAIWNGLTAARDRAISKTPGLRDITNIRAPISGNTNITEELFTKQKAIDGLLKYYQKIDPGEGDDLNTKAASKTGGLVADKLLGPAMPEQPAGLSQPPPTNPLYSMFMTSVYERFKKESPIDSKTGEDTGAIGYRSLWRRYGDATENIRRLRAINPGNMVTWQRQLEQRPEQLKYLEENGVDHTKLNEVRNFYEKKRQDASRVILFTIKAVENEFSEALGQPVRIEDLDPYGNGLPSPKPGGQLSPASPPRPAY